MTSNIRHRKKLRRYNTPNHACELTFSCYQKYPYFSNPIACIIFLDFLDSVRKKYKEHLILNTQESFDVFCIEVKGKKRFQFWQPGGGYDRNLWNPKPIHPAIDYIENNPVRAELVSHPDDWRWSSTYARENNHGLMPDDSNIPMLMK